LFPVHAEYVLPHLKHSLFSLASVLIRGLHIPLDTRCFQLRGLTLDDALRMLASDPSAVLPRHAVEREHASYDGNSDTAGRRFCNFHPRSISDGALFLYSLTLFAIAFALGGAFWLPSPACSPPSFCIR